VLFLGTLVESWYGRPAALQVVYGTWWFVTLLGLLGLNIFFAAVKKWPWQRHQVGFLITHVGLLTLVTGGVVDSLLGTTGSIALVDDARLAHLDPHTTSRAIDRSVQMIRVRRSSRPSAEALGAAFAPGPLPWPDDSACDVLPRVLSRLAHPWPRSWSCDVGDGVRLDVLAYHPHTRAEPYGPATDAEVPSFAALQVQLASAQTGLLPPVWVACQGSRGASRVGPGLVEFLAHQLTPGQLQEFKSPPLSAGPEGQLVVGLAGRTHRVDVAAARAEQPLGSGWELRIVEHVPNVARPGDRLAADPAVMVQLHRGEGRPIRLRVMARQGGELSPGSVPLPDDFWMWYHPPDPRYGEDRLRGLLQFATTADGALWYRSLHGDGRVESVGPVALSADGPSARQRIWSGMGAKFQVLQYLPRAQAGPHFVPLEQGPADVDSSPALRCRLANEKKSVEFWIGRSDAGYIPVVLGSETFQIGYHPAVRELGFELTLLRAEQATDPEGKPSTQASVVLLSDRAQGIEGQPCTIMLNQPLSHNGCKIYQAGHMSLGPDDEGRPHSRVLLVVNRDRGVWLKYAGSAMVATGILCMFLMRAYIFKGR
jgi:hypothetical protein